MDEHLQEENSFVYIYGLIDPRTNEIRYIGWTPDLVKRYKEHIDSSKREKNHKSNWIKSLRKEGREPVLLILDEVLIDDWQLAESAWIMYGLEQNWPLTNMTLGGEGVLGYRHTEETKKKISEAAKNPSEETRRKIGIAQIGNQHASGHTVSKESRRKISNALAGNKTMLGKHHSEEAKQKISEGHKNLTHSDETRKKISEGQKKRHERARLIKLQGK